MRVQPSMARCIEARSVRSPRTTSAPSRRRARRATSPWRAGTSGHFDFNMTGWGAAHLAGNISAGLLDAAAVAGDFDLRHVRWDQPGIERIAHAVLAAGDARPPTFQRDNLNVDLLAGGEVDICVLVDIP